MRFRNKLTVLTLISLTIIMLVLLGSRFQVNHLIQTTNIAYQDGLQLSETMDAARQSQVSFQRQVQEWKNTMLRGSDLTLQAKYWNGFKEREAEMQRGLSALKQQLIQLKMTEATGKVNQLLLDHQQLGQQYRAAIQPYLGQPMTLEMMQQIDTAVRGIDRPTSAGMDGLVHLMQQQVQQRFDQQALSVRNQANRQQGLLFLVILTGAFLFSLGMIILIHKLLQALGADPEDAVAATARIATGDLTQALHAQSPHSLIGALEMMQLRLRNIYLAIDAAATHLKQQANQLPEHSGREEFLGDIQKLDAAINRIKIKRAEDS